MQSCKSRARVALGKKSRHHELGLLHHWFAGETEETIRETIDFAKKLPLDIALFHVAAPYPGTPFFFEVVKNNWFRPGTRWEQVDMDKGTVLDYPDMPAERLLYWQKRAFREWAFRPGPFFTYLENVDVRLVHYENRSERRVTTLLLGILRFGRTMSVELISIFKRKHAETDFCANLIDNRWFALH